MFRDNYTDFYYNDIHSKYYSVWITNNHDLSMNLSPNFSDKFVNPTYNQTRYYEGTTIDKQDLKLNLVAVNVTKSEWRAISSWLSPTSQGRFSFGWDPTHYYMVKPTSAPNGVYFVESTKDSVVGDKYIITFSITLTTTDDWAALSTPAMFGLAVGDTTNIDEYQSSVNVGERYKNAYGIPYAMLTKSGGTLSTSAVAVASYITIHKPTNPSTICIYDGSILQNMDFKDQNSKQHYRITATSTAITVQEYIAGIESAVNTITANYTSSGTYVLDLRPGSFVTTDGQALVDYSNNNLILANPGTYKLYPKMYIDNNNFTLQNDLGQNIIKYSSNTGNHCTVSYDSRTGTTLCGGQFLQTVVRGNQKVFYSGIVSEQLHLAPGQPELITGNIVYTKNSQTSEISPAIYVDSQVPNGYIKIKVDHPFTFNRYGNYICSIFQSKSSDTIYGDKFNTAFNSNPQESILILNPTIDYDESTQIMTIYGLRNIPTDVANPTTATPAYYGADFSIIPNKNWHKVYIGICNVEEYNIATPNPKVIYEAQTRDVI